jgi:hypothetical protein
LALREEKTLARVKTAINGGKGCVLACNFENAWKAEQVQRRSTRLEYKAVWRDK